MGVAVIGCGSLTLWDKMEKNGKTGKRGWGVGDDDLTYTLVVEFVRSRTELSSQLHIKVKKGVTMEKYNWLLASGKPLQHTLNLFM